MVRKLCPREVEGTDITWKRSPPGGSTQKAAQGKRITLTSTGRKHKEESFSSTSGRTFDDASAIGQRGFQDMGFSEWKGTSQKEKKKNTCSAKQARRTQHFAIFSSEGLWGVGRTLDVEACFMCANCWRQCGGVLCVPTSGKALVSWVNGRFFTQQGLYLEKDAIQAIIPNSWAFRSISQAPERYERNSRRRPWRQQ